MGCTEGVGPPSEEQVCDACGVTYRYGHRWNDQSDCVRALRARIAALEKIVAALVG